MYCYGSKGFLNGFTCSTSSFLSVYFSLSVIQASDDSGQEIFLFKKLLCFLKACSLMLFLVACLVFLLLAIEREYDPVRANASELAAKRKRLSQIEQQTQATDISEG